MDVSMEEVMVEVAALSKRLSMWEDLVCECEQSVIQKAVIPMNEIKLSNGEKLQFAITRCCRCQKADIMPPTAFGTLVAAGHMQHLLAAQSLMRCIVEQPRIKPPARIRRACWRIIQRIRRFIMGDQHGND